MSGAAGRILLAATAVTALAWLALALGDVRAERAGIAITRRAAPALSAAEVASARERFRRARAHSRDTGPIVREAQLLLFARRPAQAAALLEVVVRREPANLDAWRLLAQAAAPLDAARAAAARARARTLSPPAAPPR